jgi:hypothetical protein
VRTASGLARVCAEVPAGTRRRCVRLRLFQPLCLLFFCTFFLPLLLPFSEIFVSLFLVPTILALVLLVGVRFPGDFLRLASIVQFRKSIVRWDRPSPSNDGAAGFSFGYPLGSIVVTVPPDSSFLGRASLTAATSVLGGGAFPARDDLLRLRGPFLRDPLALRVPGLFLLRDPRLVPSVLVAALAP